MSPETARLLDKLYHEEISNELYHEISAALLYGDRLKYELKLAYGLAVWDNSDAIVENLENILTKEEMQEACALVEHEEVYEETMDEGFDRRHAEAVEQFMEYYGYPPEDEDHSDLEVVEDILSHIPVQDIETHNKSMSYATDPDFVEFETRQQYARWYEAEEEYEDAD